MTDLEKLRMIKLFRNRKVEFYVTGTTDSLFTTIKDKDAFTRNKLVDLLIDTTIKFLEKEDEKKNCN